jgi:hypothetical protein
LLSAAAAAALIREENIFFCRVEQISHHHRIRKLEQTRQQLTIAKSFYE